LIKNLGAYFKSALNAGGFWPRSEERDAETDRDRLRSIVAAIENALHAAEIEKYGLSQRVNDALSRAAVTFGNGSDEYLEREPLDNHHQDLLATEISNGERRLKELTIAITHFEFLKAEVLSRFPSYKPGSAERLRQ
jgi:hypothetical protein